MFLELFLLIFISRSDIDFNINLLEETRKTMDTKDPSRSFAMNISPTQLQRELEEKKLKCLT